MIDEILKYNNKQSGIDKEICDLLTKTIDKELTEAECKIWHAHPVWFINGNPVAGYSKLKAGVRLMFWSGADFEDDKLMPGSGKFKDASITYSSLDQIITADLIHWLELSRKIQWDYKNIVKRKGRLERIITE